MLKKSPLSALLVSVFALSLSTAALADDDHGLGHNETEDEISEHGTNGMDLDHVATQVGGSATRVTTRSDGSYEVTLANGSVVLVKPRGNTRIHKRSTGVNSTDVDSDGHLHLQTADGYEMTVESAQHDESETHHILGQNGLSNVTTTGGRVTGTRRDGSLVSLEADYEVRRSATSGAVRYQEDETGVDIDYADGTRQRFHGAPVDTNQLRTSAQSMGYTVTFNSDGSANARATHETRKVRLSPTLSQGLALQPGLRVQNGRVIMQYQNGQEQEVIVLQ